MSHQNSAKVVWKGEGINFTGKVGSGYEFDVGGGSNKIGGSPMEYLLIGLVGCTAVDVVSMLEKQRQNVLGLEVAAVGLRADDYPMVYTDVTVNYLVLGKDIDPRAVERAIELSEEKYCSASAMFKRSGANIIITFEIIEVDE
ncbi:MAG: OsmC family protein [Candidatus Promineifilaceae bacterium]|jgi:putative redox protein